MRTIIAGSREIEDIDILIDAIEEAEEDGIEITEVVSGGARGVDRLGEKFAKVAELPVKQFIPNWKPNGVFDKGAGHKRNREMAQYADALIALWDGESPGTANMIKEARNLELDVFIKIV